MIQINLHVHVYYAVVHHALARCSTIQEQVSHQLGNVYEVVPIITNYMYFNKLSVKLFICTYSRKVVHSWREQTIVSGIP